MAGAMVTRDDIERITAFLDERFGLDTLWLYGSEAQGKARPDSDVDLGVLFRRRPEMLELFDAQSDLAEILRRDVDLVDLDQASPILGMQVLKHGRLLLDRNPERRYAAYSRILHLYEDLKILRRETDRALFQRMSSGQP